MRGKLSNSKKRNRRPTRSPATARLNSSELFWARFANRLRKTAGKREFSRELFRTGWALSVVLWCCLHLRVFRWFWGRFLNGLYNLYLWLWWVYEKIYKIFRWSFDVEKSHLLILSNSEFVNFKNINQLSLFRSSNFGYFVICKLFSSFFSLHPILENKNIFIFIAGEVTAIFKSLIMADGKMFFLCTKNTFFYIKYYLIYYIIHIIEIMDYIRCQGIKIIR